MSYWQWGRRLSSITVHTHMVLSMSTKFGLRRWRQFLTLWKKSVGLWTFRKNKMSRIQKPKDQRSYLTWSTRSDACNIGSKVPFWHHFHLESAILQAPVRSNTYLPAVDIRKCQKKDTYLPTVESAYDGTMCIMIQFCVSWYPSASSGGPPLRVSESS